jgi:glutathione peroxidase
MPLSTKLFASSDDLRPSWIGRLLVLLGFTLLVIGPQADASSKENCPASLSHTFPRLQDDVPQSLCQFKGQVVLVVNTASYCGFTQQYEQLEKIYDRYRAKGLVVLGFPSNDFGNQEPGSNEQIAAFCSNTFGVKFPMFAKSSVKGEKANPLFKQLARQAESPGWNFHKYILDRNGVLIRSYSSQVSPTDRRLITDIERALAAQAS